MSLTLLLLTLAVFAIAMTVMSVGVIFSGRCLRGSCGGSEVLDAAGNPMSCATCPKRKKGSDEAEADDAPEKPLASIGVRTDS